MEEPHFSAGLLTVNASSVEPRLREEKGRNGASSSDSPSRDSTPSYSSFMMNKELVGRKNDLQFITMTDPNQSRGARNRKIVRSHAMRHVRQQRSELTDPAVVSRISSSKSSHGSSTSTPNAANVTKLPLEVFENSFQVEPLKSHDVPRPQTQGEAVAVRPRPRLKSPSPLTPLGAGRIDPFQSFAVEIKPYCNYLLDHFVHVVGPSHMPIGGAHSPLVTELVPLARGNPALFHGILCVTASHMTIDKGERTPQYIETFHRGESFRMLGDLLSDAKKATSDTVVATILILSGFEVLFGLGDDHEAHMSGLDQIIATRGGLDKLGYGGLLKMMITWAFHFRTQRKHVARQLNLGSESGPSSCLLTEGPHASELLDEDTTSSLPTGFQGLRRKGLINAALIKSIEMLLSLTVVLNDPPAPTIENVTIISESRMKVEELLEAQHNSYSSAPKYTVGECCCIALLLYDHTVLRIMPRGSAILMEHSNGLKDSLSRIPLDLEAWGTGRHLLLWVLFIGYSSTIDFSMRYWFASHVQEILSESPWIVDARDLKKIFKTFLWSEKGHVRPFDELWALMIKNTAGHDHGGHGHTH